MIYVKYLCILRNVNAKEKSWGADLSVDSSDIFSDNYKDIYNFPHTDLSCFHKINLNYKTAVKSNNF